MFSEFSSPVTEDADSALKALVWLVEKCSCLEVLGYLL